MSDTYDEALFRQLLGKRGRHGVTLDDVTDVFMVVAYDVVEAIRQQRPDIPMNAVWAIVRRDLAPGLAEGLRQEGWTIL